jgi:Fe-Mn family superoxide dismutase
MPYSYDFLKPNIDPYVIFVHSSKQNKDYVDRLNNILKKINYNGNYSLEDIIKNIDEFPFEYRGDILYSAGGIVNHELYWKSMGNMTMPSGELLNQINKQYGSFENFKNEFKEAANNLVGSGYTFLVMDKDKNLNIINMSNEETPITYGFIPLLVIDLWEHAYYLQYLNDKNKYIENFFNVINFDYANKKYNETKK